MIAFCFLLYDSVQHSSVWENLFRDLIKLGVKFTIYTHLKTITDKTQKWVSANKIKSIPTGWGEYSLLKASMLMYREALKNKKNQYFILLSGSDIPLQSATYLANYLQRDNKSHLDIRYNKRYDVWAASQWMYLSKQGATQLTRLLDPKDKEATKFLKFWKKETDPHGEDCTICEIYGADEAIPTNWFIYLYGQPYTKTFCEHIKNSCVTYAYFKTKYTQSPKTWTSRTLTGYRLWEMKKCLFGRKYEESALAKVYAPIKFTATQLKEFKERKKKDGPTVHWGQPQS